MNLFVFTLYPLIPLEAVTIADRSLDFFIGPLHLGQVFEVDIDNYFGLECIKRFHKMGDKCSDYMLLNHDLSYYWTQILEGFR